MVDGPGNQALIARKEVLPSQYLICANSWCILPDRSQLDTSAALCMVLILLVMQEGDKVAKANPDDSDGVPILLGAEHSLIVLFM